MSTESDSATLRGGGRWGLLTRCNVNGFLRLLCKSVRTFCGSDCKQNLFNSMPQVATNRRGTYPMFYSHNNIHVHTTVKHWCTTQSVWWHNVGAICLTWATQQCELWLVDWGLIGTMINSDWPEMERNGTKCKQIFSLYGCRPIFPVSFQFVSFRFNTNCLVQCWLEIKDAIYCKQFFAWRVSHSTK